MGLSIFTALAVLTGITFLVLTVRGFIVKVLELNGKKISIILDAIEPFLRRSFRVLLIGLLAVFITAAIIPYMLNQSDAANIKFSESNIELYEEYIDEYSNAARQQIEEYQKLQAEMARSASSTQLQFWAQQQDEVGNSLTNKIQEFKSYIMDSQVEINKRKAKISQRSLNKWFFWHEL